MHSYKTFKQFIQEEELTRGNGMSLDFKRLTSFKGIEIPDIVDSTFTCINNDLTSLEGAPKEITKGGFYCDTNKKITSFEGCPTKIVGDCSFSKCGLTSLQGIHKYFKNGYIQGSLYIERNPIESHILGVLLIPKLKEVHARYVHKETSDFIKAAAIVNKHLLGDRDVIECQQELIDAGLKAFAQL